MSYVQYLSPCAQILQTCHALGANFPIFRSEEGQKYCRKRLGCPSQKTLRYARIIISVPDSVNIFTAPDSDDDPNDKNYNPPRNPPAQSEEDSDGPEDITPVRSPLLYLSFE